MRRTARILTPIAVTSEGSRRVSIPRGQCELDEGPHGTGPYMIYLKEGARAESFELTLTEYVSYVTVSAQPSTGASGRRRNQLFKRD